MKRFRPGHFLVCLTALAVIPCALGQGQTITVHTDPSPEAAEKGGDAKADAGKTDQPVGSSEVRVSEYLTVDIIAQADSITNVLQKLAVQARRNIVPSAAVTQTVNATMYGVPFYDALQGLLRPYGLGYVEDGDFIFVYTNDELKTLNLGKNRVTQVVHLNYLRSEDAKEVADGLISEVGKVWATKDLREAGEATQGGDLGKAVGSEQTVYIPQVDEYALGNSVIVNDLPEYVARIQKILTDLDGRPSQVLLECTIVESVVDEANGYGIDFALLSGVNFTEFFNFPINLKPNASLGVEEGFLLGNPGNTAAGSGAFKAGAVFNDDVGIFLRALDQVTDVTLLANPKILALNRQRARVLIGERVGYLEVTVVENQVLQTVQFIDTGVALDIRPYILNDGRIRLELDPKVSDVDFRQVQSAQGFAQDIPQENVQTLTTNVLVQNGSTAVLGGMFREDTNKSRNQVPLLGDIPFVGALFRGQDEELGTVEIMFLIKATILDDSRLDSLGADAKAYSERVRVGSRLGLLPWSRERQSSRLNLAAERLAGEGRYDEALWNVRRSLELHPFQPEAIRIRQQLVTARDWWPTRSYLQRMIDRESDRDFPLAPGNLDGN